MKGVLCIMEQRWLLLQMQYSRHAMCVQSLVGEYCMYILIFAVFLSESRKWVIKQYSKTMKQKHNFSDQ